MIKREAILQAILTLLDGIEYGAGDTCPAFRSRSKALSSGQRPAIVILPGVDTPTQPHMANLDWSFVVNMGVYTIGDVPDSLGNEISGAIHTALCSDLTLGGLCLDINVAPVSFDFDPTEKDSGATILSYVVKYRTDALSLA